MSDTFMPPSNSFTSSKKLPTGHNKRITVPPIFLAGAHNMPWMPYKYHTFLLQAKIDNNAAVSFLDFSLSPAININMANVVHTSNQSENSGLIKINFMCLNGCNSNKALKIKKLLHLFLQGFTFRCFKLLFVCINLYLAWLLLHTNTKVC